VIKAKKERDVMTCDIPNALIQAYLPKKEPGKDRVLMKIAGVLVNMLVDINPELYGPAVVLEKCLNSMYGKHGQVTATHGQIHDYLEMELDYQKQGELKINMTKYVKNMLNNFPVKLRKKDMAKMPDGDNLFNLGTGAKLDTKRSEYIPHICGKRIFPM
jgi:hypothetical protein